MQPTAREGGGWLLPATDCWERGRRWLVRDTRRGVRCCGGFRQQDVTGAPGRQAGPGVVRWCVDHPKMQIVEPSPHPSDSCTVQTAVLMAISGRPLSAPPAVAVAFTAQHRRCTQTHSPSTAPALEHQIKNSHGPVPAPPPHHHPRLAAGASRSRRVRLELSTPPPAGHRVDNLHADAPRLNH